MALTETILYNNQSDSASVCVDETVVLILTDTQNMKTSGFNSSVFELKYSQIVLVHIAI